MQQIESVKNENCILGHESGKEKRDILSGRFDCVDLVPVKMDCSGHILFSYSSTRQGFNDEADDQDNKRMGSAADYQEIGR